MTDPRVEAIRKDSKVGRGSCSSIDECWSDTEIVAILNGQGITSPTGAVNWALEQEGLFLESGLNQRWGEDDDEQLTAYREFNKED